MTKIYDPRLSRHIWKKTKSFVKGTVEGIAYSFTLANFHDRLRRCDLYPGENRTNGRAIGFSASLFAHTYLLLSLPEDKALYSLVPIALTNLLSLGKIYLRRKRELAERKRERRE